MKTTLWQLLDNVATGLFTCAALWHGLWHQKWDAAIFFVLMSILCQLPPRTMWRK